MQAKKRYERSFKEHVVKLCYERSSITELAKELGILPDRIYSWLNEFARYEGFAKLQTAALFSKFVLSHILKHAPIILILNALHL